HKVARGMAGAAVAETFDKISAFVPLGVLRWIRPERALVEEQRFPDCKGRTDVERKAEIVATHRLTDRRNGCQEISIDRIDVGIVDLREMVVGKRWIKVITFAIDTILHGTTKRLLGPGSDPGLRIRRDVRGVDGSKWGLERQIAGKGRAVWTR